MLLLPTVSAGRIFYVVSNKCRYFGTDCASPVAGQMTYNWNHFGAGSVFQGGGPEWRSLHGRAE